MLFRSRVRINVPGEEEFVLNNQDGWVKYTGKNSPFRFSPETLALAAEASSLLRSDAFMAMNVRNDRQALLLISWGYASDAARLHVIELPKKGPPVVVFNDLLDVDDIRDFDYDGLKEIAGSPWLYETIGDNLQTYDPKHVLHFGQTVGAKLKLSIPLSRAYNEKHLYGWAGPNSSEKLLVFKPKTGKPRILPEEEAHRLAESESAK